MQSKGNTKIYGLGKKWDDAKG